MKPRIQCVTQWNPGSIASGSGPSFMINSANGQTVLVVLM